MFKKVNTDSNLSKGDEKWLKTPCELLTFFLNLYNFMVLFSMCKSPQAKFPKTYKDWQKYLRTITFKVGPYFFSALEIQHSILRAGMGPPNIFDSIKEVEYPFLKSVDPRVLFKYPRRDVLVNFGFYSPHKSSPPLRVYNVNNAIEELKEVADQSFKDVKFAKNPKKLKFPGIIEFYQDEFYADVSMLKFKECIKSCLPESSAAQLDTLFASWYYLK